MAQLWVLCSGFPIMSLIFLALSCPQCAHRVLSQSAGLSRSIIFNHNKQTPLYNALPRTVATSSETSEPQQEQMLDVRITFSSWLGSTSCSWWSVIYVYMYIYIDISVCVSASVIKTTGEWYCHHGRRTTCNDITVRHLHLLCRADLDDTNPSKLMGNNYVKP